MEMKCVFCGERVKLTLPVRKADDCPGCGRDLRCCMQCMFYDPSAYNECREVQAERVVGSERANSCEYFSPSGGKPVGDTRTGDAKKALEALFRK